MGGYVRTRTLQTGLVLLGMTAFIFGLLRLVPGDPALVMLGTRATPAALAQARNNLGLDRSLAEQYVRFVSQLLRGNLGESLVYRQPVHLLIGERLPPAMWLVAFAAGLTALLSLPLALIDATHHNTGLDYLLRGGRVLALAIPSFWLALVLIQLISVQLRRLPVSGWGDTAGEHVRHLLLPSLTIALPLAALISRNMRGSLLEQLHAEHVRAARAKGLRERVVLLRHVLRPALIPAVAIFGLQIGYLVGGTVVIESVFAIPGLGQLLATAIVARDYPVVQGVVLLITLLVTLVTLAADLAAVALDPRVRNGT